MPVGSLALALTLPLVWGGLADGLVERVRIGRTGAVLFLGGVLFAHILAGPSRTGNDLLIALAGAVALAAPLRTRLGEFGLLLGLVLLAATGAMSLDALPLAGVDTAVGMAGLVGVLAAVLADDALSASGLAVLAMLIVALLPTGAGAEPKEVFQLVWGAGAAALWTGLLIEAAARAAGLRRRRV